ncbi:hypothetical protein BCY91_17180 [Pelobium manganitolerans]|uniref:Uncharacterized protein n=2 Tax=Pelobium manganitolerans TaxID=1842495 RepID=A0A419S6D1_9SPHI|nr:hypothetical protein BCY91_17180 [Pelobium manganitolerans]
MISCEYFTSGRQFYEKGLKFYELSDGGDVYSTPELEKAIENFEKSIKKGFKERDVFDKLTWSYRILNQDNKNMERVYSLALKNFPNDIEFYFRRGDSRKELQKYKLALEDYNKAILLDKERKYEYINSAFYERGAIKYILGDTVNANKDRDIAKSITDHKLRTYKDYCKLWK